MLKLVLIDLLPRLLDELAEHSNVVQLLLQLVARLVDSFGHLVPLSIQLAEQLLLPLLSLLIYLLFLLQLLPSRLVIIQMQVILVYRQLGHEKISVGLGRCLIGLAQV